MSGTGVHLQPEDLDTKKKTELEKFGKWAAKVEFEVIQGDEGLSICQHKEGVQRLKPVLKALNYKEKTEYQIRRANSTTWVESKTPAYLIPVGSPGSVWDTSTPAVKLKIGQMVYFDKPIVIEEGMDFLLVKAG